MIYSPRQTARVEIGPILNEAGNAYDPPNLAVTIPGLEIEWAFIADPQVVRDDVGLFHINVPFAAATSYPGEWTWGTSPGSDDEGSEPFVLDVIILPAGLSLDGFKARIDKQLPALDDELEDYLAAAVEQAGQAPPKGCGRLLLPDPLRDSDDPVTRRVRLRTHIRDIVAHDPRFARNDRLVRIPDARELTQVLLDGTELTVDTDYDTVTRNGLIVALQLLGPPTAPAGGSSIVEVTGRFGFATLPQSLRDAIYILAARDYFERGINYADQVSMPDGDGTAVYYRQIPPRTKLVFDSFALPTGYVGLS